MYRNAWKRLWHAFLPCPVRVVLLSHSDALSPLPARTAPNRNAYSLQLRWTTHAVNTSDYLRWSCCSESHISELSYTEASHCRLRCRRCIRNILVRLHDFSSKSWLDRLVSGNLDLESAEGARSCDSRRPGGLRMGAMGRQTQATELQSARQEKPVMASGEAYIHGQPSQAPHRLCREAEDDIILFARE